MNSAAKFKDLVGQTLVSVVNNNDEIVFKTADGKTYRLWHNQDCCELVTVEDICGDLQDIIGSPILVAEESQSDEHPPGIEKWEEESFTWTFYKLDTAKGGVTIRWYGTSNGYYSESVEFSKDQP